MSLLLHLRFSLRRFKLYTLLFQSCILVLIIYCIFQISGYHIENTNTNAITDNSRVRHDDVVPNPMSDNNAVQEITRDQALSNAAEETLEPLKNLHQLGGQKDSQKIEEQEDIVEDDPTSQVRKIRSFFPTNFYSQAMVPEVQHYKNFFQHDPRLLPSLYISMINKELDTSGTLPEGFALPFNWNMLTDNIRKLMSNPLYVEVVKKGINCAALKEKIPYQGTNCGCEEYNDKDPENVYGLDLRIAGNTLTYFQDLNMRKLYANLHCLTGFKIPNHLIFLDAIEEGKSLIVPTEKFVDGKQDLRKGIVNQLSLGINILTEEFIEEATKSKDMKAVLLEGITGVEQLSHLAKLSDTKEIPDSFLLKPNEQVAAYEPLLLDRSLFDWNLKEEIAEMPSTDNLKTYLTQAADPNFKEVKHFGEAYLIEKKAESGHFDWRFFDGFTQPVTELHQASIHRMLRAWFKFCHTVGIYSWINHGSLIGYYWNGFTLPFDNDIDVQVPIQSLKKLAQLANDSVIFDMSHDGFVDEDFKIDSDAEIGFRSYYLDINPLFGSRTKHISRNNLIDARFISVNTGLYIDITALASFNSFTNKDVVLQQQIVDNFDKFDKLRFVGPVMYDMFYDGIKPKEAIVSNTRKEYRTNLRTIANEALEVIKSIYKDEAASGKSTQLFDKMVSCRNMHFYNLDEFLPLVPTYFENIPVYLPSNWFKNLMVEYDHNAIEVDKFKAYRWLPNMQMWISPNQCKLRGDNIDLVKAKCLGRSEYVRNEYKRLEPYIKKQKAVLKQLFPYDDPKAEIINIEDTFAIKHYHRDNLKTLFDEFDNSLLRPEPWIAENLF